MKKSNRRSFIKDNVVGGALIALSTSTYAGVPTPPEIEGPFYPLYPQKDQDFDLTQVDGHAHKAKGDVVNIQGNVIDVDGSPIENATVDIWQANSMGRYRHPHDQNKAALDPDFQGWAIVQSGKKGGFKFKTIIPGAYPVSKTWLRPPHIHFKVSKMGYEEIITQMYFPNHELNDIDQLLQRKTKAEQKMMIASAVKEQSNTLEYNIVLQKI